MNCPGREPLKWLFIKIGRPHIFLVVNAVPWIRRHHWEITRECMHCGVTEKDVLNELQLAKHGLWDAEKRAPKVEKI